MNVGGGFVGLGLLTWLTLFLRQEVFVFVLVIREVSKLLRHFLLLLLRACCIRKLFSFSFSFSFASPPLLVIRNRKAGQGLCLRPWGEAAYAGACGGSCCQSARAAHTIVPTRPPESTVIQAARHSIRWRHRLSLLLLSLFLSLFRKFSFLHLDFFLLTSYIECILPGRELALLTAKRVSENSVRLIRFVRSESKVFLFHSCCCCWDQVCEHPMTNYIDRHFVFYLITRL